MKKQHIDLVKKIEDRVVGILLTHDYVRLIDPKGPLKFFNTEITAQGHDTLKTPKELEEFIKEYMKLWPAGYRATPSAIRPKLMKFLQETGSTLEEITRATKLWLQEKETPYHGRADYFFYKDDLSRCEEYLQLIKSSPKEEADYRTKYV
ncbi:MAG: hypothetical protein KBG30_14460 [Bacteroidales bacterium]|nr:hypothetical protein [Bacteroidales bacterium]